ncbi:UDP-2,4-diacetamido-2,4,6-trideoxy-beta-L-altropyranose hydrolase [bacterium]|nr:UDP-2,4-diacetamido-2,4,6-trideoxy-beta-L-altropyranose hydrolase [bacterium]
MIDGKSVLCLIPARGGSKGIPRKNVRFLKGKPLLGYSIENALNSKYIDMVFVSTDDDEIAYYARQCGARVLNRPSQLASDDVTLEPVIAHGVKEVEAMLSRRFEIIITLQPTSPTLKVSSIDKAMEIFSKEGYDSLLSAAPDTHLAWGISKGKYIPLYEKRVNRQQLPLRFKETGGFVICDRAVLASGSRFGKKIAVFPLTREESIDIDNQTDWASAAHILGKKQILINLIGKRSTGLGHIYRGLILADELVDHNVLFTIPKNHKEGIEKLRSSNYPLEIFENSQSLGRILADFSPDIIINDTLDTNLKEMKLLKRHSKLTVSFEDMGPGSKAADLVINALYETPHPAGNHFSGRKYYCLRNDLRIIPRRPFAKKIDNILVTFGGVDEAGLTSKTLDALCRLNIQAEINVVLGLGFKGSKELEKTYANKSKVNIYRDVKNMGEFMGKADLGITSAGRTVYEFSSLAVPTLVMAQNPREMRHRFASLKNGIYFLGRGDLVSPARLERALKKIASSTSFRKKMYDRLCVHDLGSGASRVVSLILTYERKK